MMPRLDTMQRAVEGLYDEAILKGGLVEEREDCIHNCNGSCACEFLRDRIQKNLRMVLCDIIVLKHYQEDTILIDEPTLV